MHACHRFGLLLAAALALAGCESSFNVDVVADGYGDARAVTLNLDGLQVAPLGTGNPRNVTRDVTLALAVPARTQAQSTDLVSDAKIADDEYDGVRLRFDETEGSLVDSRTGSAGTFPIVRANGDDPDDDPFADVAFMFDQDDDETVSVIVAVDVPLSLRFDDGNNEYRLDPVVRAMESGDEASVSGTVRSIPAGAECSEGVAVYAFEGDGIVPDERGGGSVEPIASAPVATDGSFTLRFLPDGDYTLAATCEAEEDNGTEDRSDDDEIDFGDGEDVRLTAGEDERGVVLDL